ncbi:hypothetical protein GW17_00000157, partial [Ensete ventricosum]
ATLNLIDEIKAEAHLKVLRYKITITTLYNRDVYPLKVGVGDLELQKAEVNDPITTRDMLVPNKGPIGSSGLSEIKHIVLKQQKRW